MCHPASASAQLNRKGLAGGAGAGVVPAAFAVAVATVATAHAGVTSHTRAIPRRPIVDSTPLC